MQRAAVIFFSPTGNARKIGEWAGKVLSEALTYPLEIYDLTRPEGRITLPHFDENDVLIVVMPVYAGRLPNKIMPELKGLIYGNNTPTLAFVTYGNRHYDDALSELCLILKEKGCIPFAAGALPSEHAFSKKLAPGRPRAEDLEALTAFVREQLKRFKNQEKFSPVKVSGNNPPGPYYTPLGTDGLPAKFLKAKPKTDTNRCMHCGKCAAVCSMGSVSQEDFSEIKGICIKCQACVKNCPVNAKYFDDPAFLSHVAMLEDFAVGEKAVEFFNNQFE